MRTTSTGKTMKGNNMKANKKAVKAKTSAKPAKAEKGEAINIEDIINSRDGEAVLSEYNGKPILNLTPDKERFPVQMGLSKLKAVLECLDQVKTFVESNGAEC